MSTEPPLNFNSGPDIPLLITGQRLVELRDA
jgi:hypothetical protein